MADGYRKPPAAFLRKGAKSASTVNQITRAAQNRLARGDIAKRGLQTRMNAGPQPIPQGGRPTGTR